MSELNFDKDKTELQGWTDQCKYRDDFAETAVFV